MRAISGESLGIAAAIVALIGTSEIGVAQQDLTPANGMVAPVDLYGNAQALHPERRSLDIFQNEIQRRALTGYETFSQTSQRGYGTPFALPSDRFMQAMEGRLRPNFALPSSWRERPSPFGLREREKKAAYSSYGGFGDRRRAYNPEDPEGLFARKRSLIAATSSAAPIERTKLSAGRLGSIRYPTIRTPTPTEVLPGDGTTTSPVPPAGAAALSRFLTIETKVLHDRANAEGWAQFEAGDYRAAIRTFESAAMLDENDAEARIATIFGYFALGSYQTAYFSLETVQRRDPNPFRHNVKMATRFKEGTRGQQVRLAAAGMAEASGLSPEMKALATYVLWYLGEKDDALRAARSLVGSARSGMLSRWPELMQAVLAQSPTEHGIDEQSK